MYGTHSILALVPCSILAAFVRHIYLIYVCHPLSKIDILRRTCHIKRRRVVHSLKGTCHHLKFLKYIIQYAKVLAVGMTASCHVHDKGSQSYQSF